ncbi:hypothetical protein FBQ96_16275 [Nitrospirales bacterium NOB]|nr:hypothetical protein [Nitrospirota bacterium]MCE7967088.1 hypothetical protein [Nitrospira sp. NTP2]MCK6491898.1 hypothetical protein [Nitrospira sp.]MDL1891098.1 hypothetical protein [Nitrospirales bacterium NOB]MEB2340022.1 hypothetical protein [Nitrospirales bacterium]
MPDLPRPTIHAFLACDYVIEDSLTRKRSLIGIFTHLQAASFPFQHQQLGLYFCMTDAEGTYHFDIDLVYLPTEELVCRASLPHVAIPNRRQMSDVGINIPVLVFPAPGRYEFRLHVEGQVIARSEFSVVQTVPPPGHQASPRPS